MTTVTYTLAVHEATGWMEANVTRVVERLRAFPGSEVILVENGSTDGSLAMARDLAARLGGDQVAIRVETVARGLGHAHRRGLELARGELVVVIGVDLPFAFSDLDAWLDLTDPPPVVLGSKSHPGSRLGVSRGRRLVSLGFRLTRRLLLGIPAGDTQGSILISGQLARRIAPRLRCTDYLVTTEIVAWAIRLGAHPLEVPVVYPGTRAPSTIRPLRDPARMLAGMFALRRRLRNADAATLTLTTSEEVR